MPEREVSRAIAYFNGLRPWLLLAGYWVGALTVASLLGGVTWRAWLAGGFVVGACIIADFRRVTPREGA